jgi:hypothetical protein
LQVYKVRKLSGGVKRMGVCVVEWMKMSANYK